MFDALFLVWSLLVVTGAVLSVRGARKGNARKQLLGRRLLQVAAVAAIVGFVGMIYLVAVAGST